MVPPLKGEDGLGQKPDYNTRDTITIQEGHVMKPNIFYPTGGYILFFQHLHNNFRTNTLSARNEQRH